MTVGPIESPNGADGDETTEAMMYDGWGFVPLSEAKTAAKPAKSSEEHSETA